MKKNSQTTSTVEKHEGKEQYPQAIIGEFSKSNAPYKILSVKLQRNYLEIEVSYSGGCEQHEFNLIGSKYLSKSLPPIRNVQLVHLDKQDKCKSIVTEKLKFSISSLAENTNPGNKIKLQIEGFKDMIEYSYE